MIKKLLQLLSGKKPVKPLPREKPKGKQGFEYTIYEKWGEAEPNVWFRLEEWEFPYSLVFNWDDVERGTDWVFFKKGGGDEYPKGIYKVAGVTFDDRMKNFLLMGDAPDFSIYLVREPDNPKDPNAIKVMGRATVQGKPMSGQLGYVDKKTAKALKSEKEMIAIPYSTTLPIDGAHYHLKIRLLVKNIPAWKKSPYE